MSPAPPPVPAAPPLGSSTRVPMLPMAATVVVILPPFLVATLSVEIARDLPLSTAQVGLTSSLYFFVSFLGAARAGRFAQRIGPRRAVAVAMVVVATSLAGVAAAGSVAALMAAVAAGGVASAVAHPGINLWVLQRAGQRRLGLALGIKQAALPAATLLAGATVPTVALRAGWRPAFALAAAVAAALGGYVIASRRVRGQTIGWTAAGEPDAALRDGVPRRLVMLAVVGALAAATGTFLGSYFVIGGVDAGLSHSAAALALTTASLGGIVVRVAAGAVLDRLGPARQHQVMFVLMGLGTVGFLLLVPSGPGSFHMASFVAFGFGWSWPGVFQYAVVQGYQGSAAVATGVAQTGISIGGSVGPLALGQVATQGSLTVAWTCCAVLLSAACLFFMFGARAPGVVP